MPTCPRRCFQRWTGPYSKLPCAAHCSIRGGIAVFSKSVLRQELRWGRAASISMFTATWVSVLHFSLFIFLNFFYPSYFYVLSRYQIAFSRFSAGLDPDSSKTLRVYWRRGKCQACVLWILDKRGSYSSDGSVKQTR